MAFYYRFKAECSPGMHFFKSANVRSFAAGDTWEHTRYKLEKAHGLFDAPRQEKANLQGCYFTGYWFADYIGANGDLKKCEKIDETCVMMPDDAVVVVRKPLDARLRMWVPLDIDAVESASNRALHSHTEEARVTETTANARSNDTCLPEWHKKHPCHFEPDAHGNRPWPVPYSERYVCGRCFQKGHYKEFCETPVSDIPRARGLPKGVPLSRFRPYDARTDSVSSAFLESDGTLWVYKSE